MASKTCSSSSRSPTVAISRTSVSVEPLALSLMNSISGCTNSLAYASSAAKDKIPRETHIIVEHAKSGRVSGPTVNTWARVLVPPSMSIEKRVDWGA